MTDEANTPACGEGDSRQRTVDSEHVLIEEYCWLKPEATRPKSMTAYRKAVEGRQAALCLSGGGIRSAAFALGVMQALSRKRLLMQFDYLSTVSGGGYIGSFVQRWISVTPGGAADVMDGLASPREPIQIARLRQNSNFLTPRIGIASNDTWSAVASSMRNIIINWFLFFPLFLLVAVLPNWFLSGVDSTPLTASEHPWFGRVLLVLAGACVALSVFFTVKGLPSYRSGTSVPPGSGDGWLFARIVAPLLAWSVVGTLAIAPDLLDAERAGKGSSVYDLGGFALASTTFVAMLIGFVAAALTLERGYRRTMLTDLLIWPISFFVAAAWVLLGTYLFDSMSEMDIAAAGLSAWLTVLGPLWLLTGTLAGAVVFAAFRWADGPTVKPDADREWLARASGLKLKPMLAWAVAGFAALLLLTLLKPWISQNLTLPTIVALLSGSGAVAGGRSQNSGNQQAPGRWSLLRILPMSALIAIATFLFLIALFVVMGGLEQRLSLLLAEPLTAWFTTHKVPSWINALVVAHSLLLLACALLLWAMARLIPVNRFSLHGLYRNRLARAFLGAAREKRDPNPFTGFDSHDNIRLHKLREDDSGAAKPRVLYPVINCALNVTATENLAWQERKAEPFIFSPLYSGSGMLRSGAGAYVSSTCYGGDETDLGLGADTTGVTLATAMAISGAAASPNMGYHSSAATAFLMTLFNVRLGAWLPNPARADTLGDAISRSGPDNSLRALLRELAGSTDDCGLDIYLSDGGHFENLALYEMLRRRCRYMVVSDAGADPACAFADLGNAVRKAKIDLNCDIDFGRVCISARGNDIDPQLAWAIGHVTYEGGGIGTILYLKPSLFGDRLPVDVVAYARESGTFPHETTGDQWFSESQFESYRHLGAHFADALGPASHSPTGRVETLEDFFAAAQADYDEQIENIPPRSVSGISGALDGGDQLPEPDSSASAPVASPPPPAA